MVLTTQDSAVPDEPDRAARGVRPAAEAKEVQLVARLIVLDDKAVARANVARQAIAEHAPANMLTAPRPDARLVVQKLRDLRVVVKLEAERDLRDIRRHRNTVLQLIGVVPRPVAAHHQTLLRVTGSGPIALRCLGLRVPHDADVSHRDLRRLVKPAFQRVGSHGRRSSRRRLPRPTDSAAPLIGAIAVQHPPRQQPCV